MKNVNNRGLTVIELLLCFALVSIITVAMFKTVNSYKSKQDEESFKNDITTYKTTISKVIYDDIMANEGITNASTVQKSGTEIIDPDNAHNVTDFSYELNLVFRNGAQKTAIVRNKTRCITYERDATTGKRVPKKNQECVCSDYEADGSCKPNASNELSIDTDNSEFYIQYNGEQFDLPPVPGLKYNSIIAEQKDNGFISIHIGLWHNDYGTKYDALNIIVPNVATYPKMF